MNKEQMINQVKENISLYKNFTCPDYPELGIYSKPYMDILVKLFSDEKNPYSVVYTDVNKLSNINERLGKKVGDQTLYSLLSIFTSNPALKNSFTVRIGGDEFVTFVSNKDKAEVENILEKISNNIANQSEALHDSGFTFGVEDSSSGNIEKMLCLAEHQVEVQKNKRDKNNISKTEFFAKLPIPTGITEEQQEKWQTLNTKINIATDNHLSDLRPSSNVFEYKLSHIKTDALAFISSFRNLLEKKDRQNIEDNYSDVATKNTNISPEDAKLIHALFQGNIALENLDDKELEKANNVLTNFGENLIIDKKTGLFNKSYYKLFLADELAKSNQDYQAICYSMVGIRPRNTAYGHSLTDNNIDKTATILTENFKKCREINNMPFSFNKNDVFFVNTGGGNFTAYIPSNQAISKKENKQIEDAVNSNYTDELDSTLKIAIASKKHVNKFTIPFLVNHMNNVPNNPAEWIRTIFQVVKNKSNKKLALKSAPFEMQMHKPFVQLARKLEDICNDNKDNLKIESLSSVTNEKSIEAVANDCIDYYLSEIEDADSIDNKKFLLENVMLSLASQEAYFNDMTKKTYEKNRDERKVLKHALSTRDNENVSDALER